MNSKITFSKNAAVVVVLLGTALAVAVGCPSAPPTADRTSAPRDTQPAHAPETGANQGTAASDVATTSSAMSSKGDIPKTTAAEGPTTESPGADDAPVTTPVESSPTSEASSVADSAAQAPPKAPFADWPEPEFVFLITGRQHGYIEPCGCAGLTNQKGGLARRHTLYAQLKQKGWEVLPLDAGNQVRRYGRQAEIKFQVTAEGLRKMDYQAVALGPDDLRLSGGELLAIMTDSGDYQSPFVCANASLYGLTKSHRILEAAGRKVGVTAVLGAERLKKLQSNEVEKTSPEVGLEKVLPAFDEAKCNLRVLLANTEYEEAKALAEKFPQFDVVIAAAGAGDPAPTPEKIGETQLILVGEKSMYAGVLGVFDDPQQQFRYQRVPLDVQLQDSAFMLTLLATYQDTLKSEGLEGLGLRPVPHPSGREFVGSATCGECHTQAFEVWQNTPHHHATETLVHPGERIEIPRHHDPECLSCHVTGWNPQGYFPYKSGYVDLQQSMHLHGNGCENCHGPGSRHVAAEMGDLDLDEAAKQALRVEMRLPLDQAEKKCAECHDLDNDPDFQLEGAFAEYWEKIKHYGKD